MASGKTRKKKGSKGVISIEHLQTRGLRRVPVCGTGGGRTNWDRKRVNCPDCMESDHYRFEGSRFQMPSAFANPMMTEWAFDQGYIGYFEKIINARADSAAVTFEFDLAHGKGKRRVNVELPIDELVAGLMSDPGGRMRLIERVHAELAVRVRQGSLAESGSEG